MKNDHSISQIGLIFLIKSLSISSPMYANAVAGTLASRNP